MPYQLRIGGQPAGTFATEPEAVQAATAVLRTNADARVEIIDEATGHAAAPGASQGWQEDLAKRVGF